MILSGLPPLDWSLLTALVDRWRPETHTFHLPCGEMTVTLQDMVMILGLPCEGNAATGVIDSAAWPGMVEAMLGIAPPARAAGDRISYVSSLIDIAFSILFELCTYLYCCIWLF